MSSSSGHFRERLRARAVASSISVTNEQVEKLDRYFQLLMQWSRKINLTGFDLHSISDQAIDRLFCEALAAAQYFPARATSWVDVGSGGGSPAVPLKIVLSNLPLTMVEMRDRKCAFLREVTRELDLSRTTVLSSRVEEVAKAGMNRADVVTVRAVRSSPRLSHAIVQLLQDDGMVLAFGAANQPDWPDFTVRKDGPKLLRPSGSPLSMLTKAVFHVEQSRGKLLT